jgi:hypothetical protein
MTKQIARVVAIHMVENVRQTPFKGANETIIVALVIPAFPPVHVVLPESHELGIVRQIGGKVKTLRYRSYRKTRTYTAEKSRN